MFVEDVMTGHPITVTEAVTVEEALQLLDTYSVTSLPVVDSAGRIRGVVSEADLIRDRVLPDPLHREAPGSRRPAPLPLVGDVCSRHAVTAHPHDDLADVVDLLTSTAIKSVPVVDRKGVVLGVLSRSDVVHVLARTDAGDDDGA
jgi:CBS-domain-containing membrane protein